MSISGEGISIKLSLISTSLFNFLDIGSAVSIALLSGLEMIWKSFKSS